MRWSQVWHRVVTCGLTMVALKAMVPAGSAGAAAPTPTTRTTAPAFGAGVSSAGPDYQVNPITINKEKTVLLLCHMENDIVHPEGKRKLLATQATSAGVVEMAARALKATRETKMLVWHLRTFHRPGYQEYGRPPLPTQSQSVKDTKALLEGTWGCDFVDQCKPQGDEVIISSPTVNGVAQGDMIQELVSWQIETVVLCGVSTASVVTGTTIGLKDLGIKVIILGDCCSARNWEEHNYMLKYILPQWATITDLEQYITALKK